MYDLKQSRRAVKKPAPAPAPGPDIAALSAGAAPTQEQMGSRVDLPEGIREKMESSFGADFSNVKLFESQTVADAGAQAVTQGTNIAFAPGKLDLTSTSGQALLGHELSHVVSQARGESTGSGFLNDTALEAQADRQGMMAAKGESVYAGPVSPISTSTAMSASGPMQAKKHKNITPAQQLKKNFNNVEMGWDDKARRLGQTRQLKMLVEADAYNSSSNALTDDERAEIDVVRNELMQKIVTGKRSGEYMEALQSMRTNQANAMLNNPLYMTGQEKYVKDRIAERRRKRMKGDAVYGAMDDYREGLPKQVKRNGGKLDPSLFSPDVGTLRRMGISNDARLFKSMGNLMGQFGDKAAPSGGENDPVTRMENMLSDSAMQSYEEGVDASRYYSRQKTTADNMAESSKSSAASIWGWALKHRPKY